MKVTSNEIVFDNIEECIDIKNRLIAFIKRKKRDQRDKGIDPDLTFRIIKRKYNGKTTE